MRVLKDGAFAAAALDAELERSAQLDVRDRALATDLVYGTLRLARWLEGRLARHAPRGLGKLDVHVRAHLLLAAYQVLVLSRVPDFAAVSEAVDAIRALRGERMGGFANAILRKLAKDEKPAPGELARASLASADPELAKRIVASIGEEAALALVDASDAPPLGLRIEPASSRDEWTTRLREALPNARVEPGRVSPQAILVRGAGRVVELPGFADGAWTPQEEGSQVVALALGARAGDVVLDACAGRGNKTGLLAAAVGPTGAVDAVDLHPSKLERLREELARIGRAPRATFAVDWSKGVGAVRGPYDRILVDAPCSGTGTMRRRPELFGKRKASDLEALVGLQRAILGRAAALVRPGGRVIYAVCSILRDEAENVVATANELGLEATPFDAEPAAGLAKGEASFRLLPNEHGTDGYFVASFLRKT